MHVGHHLYGRGGNMMDYTYHHQYNMYPEYYTPQYAQQYPPVSADTKLNLFPVLVTNLRQK